MEQTGCLTYKIWDQVANRTWKVHASDICQANIREWKVPNNESIRPVRKSTLVDPEWDWDELDRWADQAAEGELVTEFEVENPDLLPGITVMPSDFED